MIQVISKKLHFTVLHCTISFETIPNMFELVGYICGFIYNNCKKNLLSFIPL